MEDPQPTLMQISVQTSLWDGREACLIDAIDAARKELGGDPDYVAAFSTPSCCEQFAQVLLEQGCSNAIQGATTCRGLLSQSGHHGAPEGSFGLFAIKDPDGSYGTSCCAFESDPEAATTVALRRALEAAGRPGELPELVWLASSPGHEEQVLASLQEELGPSVTIVGGSAADDDISGQWLVFDQSGECHQTGVVVSVMFPSTRIATAFHSGYEPTPVEWKVTRAEGRQLYELDGQPACAAYDLATDRLASRALAASGDSLLQLSTLSPLGRVDSRIGSIPMFILSHPSHANADGSISLFSEVHEGESLTLMTASQGELLERPRHVFQSALDEAGWTSEDIAGAFLIYCAGCMLAVEDSIESVSASLQSLIPEIPFLGTFTFGEQGQFLGGRSRHGNLMISCVLFRRMP